MSLSPGIPFGEAHVAAMREYLNKNFPGADITVYTWFGEDLRIVLILEGDIKLTTSLARGRQDAPSPEQTVERLGAYLKTKADVAA